MIKAIVADIEGTTSSLSFVKDLLFPYARKNIADFIHQQSDREDVSLILEDVSKIIGKPCNCDEMIGHLLQWVDEDRKLKPLKSLQGLIWGKGYRNGDFYGHIYDDAFHALKAWDDQGIALYVYSSGSVYAQKLLFGHTRHGDLNPFFKGYFDTTIGAKTDVASYREIINLPGLPASELLFLSDIQAELDAAQLAGMATVWLVRDINTDSVAAVGHKQVKNFLEIVVQ